MRLLLLSFVVCCLSEYAFSSPPPCGRHRGDGCESDRPFIVRIYEATHHMSEPASVTVISDHNGVEYQKTIKGYMAVKHRIGEVVGRVFRNSDKMASYLLEHACQVDSTEGVLVFRSAEYAEGASVEVLLTEKGSVSSEAKAHIEVRYYYGPPSGRGGHKFRKSLNCR